MAQFNLAKTAQFCCCRSALHCKDVQLTPIKMMWVLKWLLKSCCFKLLSGKKTASVQLQPVGLCCWIGCVFTPLTEKKRKDYWAVLLDSFLKGKSEIIPFSLFSFYYINPFQTSAYDLTHFLYFASFPEERYFFFLKYLSIGGKCNCERK